MHLTHSLLLGLIQGLTEFLPVSSSGHLALAQSLLEGFDQPGLLFDTLLHLATLLAVFVYFRKRIGRMILGVMGIFMPKYKVYNYDEKPLIWGVIIATIPTGVIGYLLKDHVEGFFDKPAVIGYFLIITSLMLYISDKFKGGGPVTPLRALIIGIAQGLAVFPGISRSGTTIFAGLITGMSREKAAEFSFLISIPAIIGATVLQIPHITEIDTSMLGIYAAGMLMAFISGLLAIGLMMHVVKSAKLSFFAIYCLIVGVVAILWL